MGAWSSPDGAGPRADERHNHSHSGPRARTMMNRIDRLFGMKGEARIRYKDGEFQVLSPGDFVRCAITGQIIMVADLRYWNVELQEAYASAEISLKRYLEHRKMARPR